MSEPRSKMDGEQREPCVHPKSLVMLGCFLILTVLVVIDRVELQALKYRVEELEARFYSSDSTMMKADINQNVSWKGKFGFGNVKSQMKTASRVKRQTDESGRNLNNLANLGIPEQDIAYIYGDPDILEENIRSDQQAAPQLNFLKIWRSIFSWTSPSLDELNKDLFYNVTNTDRGACIERLIWKNGWDNTWCKTANPRKEQKMLVRDKRFRFFSEAKWMKNSKENFNMTTGGAIKVGRPGIYIIHSNIHFTDVDESGSSYTLNVKPAAGGEPKQIAQCLTQYPANEDSIITPCPLWQLHPLQEGDEVFMEIQNLNWFRVEKDTLHLALIMLNNYK